MPRKKEKLIKALQINFNSLAAICDVELWKYTPLAVGMKFEYYGQYDNPEQRYNYHRLCGHAVWSNKTEESIHLIGNIFKQLKWNGQLIWVSYTSDGLRVGLDL